MKKRMMALVMMSLFSAVLFSGCVIVSGPVDEGSLLVRWTFDGAAFCPADVQDVVVRIDGLADQVVACENDQIAITGLASGTYSMQVLGIEDVAGQDEISWESSVGIAVDVIGERETVIDVDLLPAP